jgi:TolA-binding protein
MASALRPCRLAALLLLLAAVPALAAKKEEKKEAQGEEKKPGVLKLKVPGDVQPDKAGPARVRAPTSEEDPVRDAATDRLRDEQIAQLSQILPQLPEEAPSKPEMVWQLAELYWEKARYLALAEAREHDEAYGRWLALVEKEGQKAAGPEPRSDTSRSDRQRALALVQFQKVLKTYSGYERKDEVLFVVAYNLYEAGQKEEALATYDALIKQFPQSKFVPDAWVQLGEHYFASNDLIRARAAYEKAAGYQQPKLYAFALYKLAWCDYNAQQYEGAIGRFKQVIAYADAQPQGGPRDRVQLKAEALRDIVLPFAQVDAIDGAISYLREKGGERFVDAVNKLAATYFDTGKFEQAVRVYQVLIGENPQHVRAPAWQQKILLAYDKLGRRDRVLAELKVLVERFGPKSDWVRANAAQKGALQEATELAESAMRELVQDYHQEAIRTKSVATYKLARDIYRQYLETYPNEEAANGLRFYYAEILYALEEWEPAAQAYSEVVEAEPKGAFAARAAYDAILALEKQVALSKGGRRSELSSAARIDEKKAKGQVEQKRVRDERITKESQEEPIPEVEQRLIAACERYLVVAPKAKDEIVIRYKAAFVYYDHRRYVEAARRFGEIILAWPTDVWSQKAAELSMNILEVKEQWRALGELAQRFRADKDIAPPGSEFNKKLARIAEGARFKYALDLYENKRDYPLAAQEFKAFTVAYPKSEHVPLALNNGVLIAEKAGQLELVLALAGQLLRDHPKADPQLLRPARRSLVSACERTARYPEAIANALAYADAWPQDEKAPDLLFDAALWKEALGDDAGALQLWQRYLKQYPGRPDGPKIAFNVGLVLERQREKRKAADHWYGYQREYAKSASPGQLLLARYHEGLALRELSPSDKSVPLVLAEVTRRYAQLQAADRQGPLLEAAAHARFLLLEPAFADFLAIQFNYTRQQDLVYVLKVKSGRMGKLQEAYAEVIQYGSPLYTQAALCRLGEAYANYNRRLLDAPVPRGLSPEQEELYRSTLENQALPLEDKAVEAFEKAVATASRTGAYSDWMVRAEEQLGAFKPEAAGEVHRLAPVAGEPLVRIAPEGAGPKAGAGGAP